MLLISNDELPGCMAQGRTIEDALVNLEEARVDYLASLLEDGLEIPTPEQVQTVTSGGTDVFEVEISATVVGPTFLETLEEVTEKQGDSTPYRVVLEA